jgi:hypothetical protein
VTNRLVDPGTTERPEIFAAYIIKRLAPAQSCNDFHYIAFLLLLTQSEIVSQQYSSSPLAGVFILSNILRFLDNQIFHAKAMNMVVHVVEVVL